MSCPELDGTCWTCQHITKSGMKFVNDFLCNHPENREDIHAVQLKQEELEEGCENYEGHTPGARHKDELLLEKGMK